ncbi:alpha/beta-tubulin-N-acetyltransferase 9 isoform X2 [Frankliniella occidentalis]|uniref:Alpha/beta-tubulin-N-acetyltransferase 9 isoform X2 n=1 Tax=Frankliniella occidentalis TaxID=133901 RepID=A0A6J1SLN6_FRAOC|nr:alpha/beta-tubulin-N-acetyltransferase 9 isoform X2 [Frankliniella occidentalis]
MKLNENTCILGKDVVLIPYQGQHVPKYHNWMKSEELQHLTGSEPLSLEEEYEMQKSWHVDANKCTFIVLEKRIFEETGDEIDEIQCQAEAEIMIAEQSARGKRRGWEAMMIMLRYGLECININKYEVKIKLDNKASIKMFSKIGFLEISRSEVFGECTMQLTKNDDWVEWLRKETTNYRIVDYNKVNSVQ